MDLIAPYCARAEELLRAAAELEADAPVPLKRSRGALLCALAHQCAPVDRAAAAALAARWAARIAPRAADWADVSAQSALVVFALNAGGWRALRDGLREVPWAAAGEADLTALWPALSLGARARRDGSNPAFVTSYVLCRCRALAGQGGPAGQESLPPGLLWTMAQGPRGGGAARWAEEVARRWLALPPTQRRDCALAEAVGKALESAVLR